MKKGPPTQTVRLRCDLVAAARTATGQSRSTAAVEAVLAGTPDPTRVLDAMDAALVATAIRAVQAVLHQLTGQPGAVHVMDRRWYVTVPGRREAFKIPAEADPVLVEAELKRQAVKLA